MRRNLVLLLVGICLLGIGFIAGKIQQHAATGLHFEVRKEKIYGTTENHVIWQYVTETKGLPFLDSGKTTMEYRGRTIFKASVDFQEGIPFARNIKVSGTQIDWDDGELQFHLTVEDLKKEENTNNILQQQPMP